MCRSRPINWKLQKSFIQSGSKSYVNEFLKNELKSPSDLIEIHNRPNYFHLIFRKKINQRLVLYFHNDPLTMTGSRSVSDRKKLLSNATKIIFNSHWSRKRFLEDIPGLHINSEKMTVIYQSTSITKVKLNKKKKWISFVGKLISLYLVLNFLLEKKNLKYSVYFIGILLLLKIL